MEKPIEHKGRVVLVEGDRIDVEMTVEGACATCKAAKACGMGESRDKVVSLLTASAGLYEVGDEVMVSIERKMGIKAATYAYIFPFFIMVYYAVLACFRHRIERDIIFKLRKI